MTTTLHPNGFTGSLIGKTVRLPEDYKQPWCVFNDRLSRSYAAGMQGVLVGVDNYEGYGPVYKMCVPGLPFAALVPEVAVILVD